MKILRLTLLGLVLAHSLFELSLTAQVYNPRRMTRRAAPPPVQLAQTNAVAAPAPVTPSPVPAASLSTNSPATNRIVYRIVQPTVDPAKAKAAKEEAVRKTIEFQKKRAEEGSESAQYELGLRYLKGDGVEKDEVSARKWLTMSSTNGFTAATKKLEELDKPAKAKEEK